MDRGPDSAGVLRLVAAHLDSPGWVQLAGNHEWQYLPDGDRFWPEPIADADADTLRAWWADGRLRVAASVRTAGGDDLLITHAGLTVAAWQALGEPITAAAAARSLNERPALIGHGFTRGDFAGPLWAEAGSELYEPWMEYYAAGGFVPFGQVHGHSQIVDFESRQWRGPGRVRNRADVDWAARHCRVRIGGRVFTGVDPKHGRSGAREWRPMVLTDAEILDGDRSGSR